MIHTQADQLELGRLIRTVIETLDTGTLGKEVCHIESAWDANKVELGARHCTRGGRPSGGLVAWVNLPHIEGYYRHYSQRHTLERRFKPGYAWAQVSQWLGLMYKEAYTQWAMILRNQEQRLALESHMATLGDRRARFIAAAEWASGEGRQDCYESMSDDDFAYWHLICSQIEAESA